MNYVPPPGYDCLTGKAEDHWTGYHIHRCRECGARWKHRRIAIVNAFNRGIRDANEKAHTCPRCGAGPYYNVSGWVTGQDENGALRVRQVPSRLERVAHGITIVAGIFGIAALASHLADGVKETRKLVRGND